MDNRVFLTHATEAASRVTSSNLTIANIRAEDGGSYACVALNKVGRKTNEQRINVYGE